MKLTTYFNLVPRLRITGAVNVLLLPATMAHRHKIAATISIATAQLEAGQFYKELCYDFFALHDC
jgi:hypothetical protein